MQVRDATSCEKAASRNYYGHRQIRSLLIARHSYKPVRHGIARIVMTNDRSGIIDCANPGFLRAHAGEIYIPEVRGRGKQESV
jgi:hypothetical protein